MFLIYIAEMPGIGGIWRIQDRYTWKDSLVVCCSFFAIRKRFRDQNPVSSRGAVSVCSDPGLIMIYGSTGTDVGLCRV